jgi:acetylornithine deacetylase/succinyl-diaminopimelate desuccinylase-like protein
VEEATVAGAASLGAQAVELCAELIRFNTVNPPGNEADAQRMLAARLGDAGFECRLLSAEEGRPNLVADLPGESEGPVLCLLSHVDTVAARPEEWSFDPWSGEIRDGMVRGRGAQDMKDQVAAEVAAAIHLARDGWRPARGALKVVVTADEEAGADVGAKWLCEEQPEAVRSDLVVNEGGGAAFELGGKRFYTLCVGEKGPFRFTLRARGRAGHGSVPALGDNALLRLAPLITKLAEQPPLEPDPAGVAFLEGVLGHAVGSDPEGSDPGSADLEAALEELRALSPEVAAYLAEPMLGVTLVPTKARASEKENVIPSVAETVVDCRVPPGLGEDAVRARIDSVLGELPDRVELEFIDRIVGNSSPVESELADAIAEWLAGVDRDASLVPIVMPGFSDSHWFRRAFGSATVYGFCPQRELDLFAAAPLVHGADELAAVDDVALAADCYRHLVTRMLG